MQIESGVQGIWEKEPLSTKQKVNELAEKAKVEAERKKEEERLRKAAQ